MCFTSKKLKTDDKSLSKSKCASKTGLPDDVIFMHILPRLSYKSLSKFKCVSTTWHKTISNDTKLASSQSLCASPTSCGFVFAACKHNKIGIFETSGSPVGINPRHHLFTIPGVECTRVLASSCGLMCILSSAHGEIANGAPYFFYIGNLATEEVGHIIPTDQIHGYSAGLAFDPLIEPNSYKLVTPIWIGNFPNFIAYEFKVYSSDTGGWVRSSKRLSIRLSPFRPEKAVTLENVIYWDCYAYMISFDPWKDIASYILLPKLRCGAFWQEIGTCNGRITCTRIIHNQDMEVYFFYESEKRWERKYRVDLDMLIDANPDMFQVISKKLLLVYEVHPFPYNGGATLFFRIQGRVTEYVFSYDLKSKKVELCEFHVREADRGIHMYHNSMVKMPGLQSK